MRLATGVPTRVAQGGIALGLVLSMGAVVVTADGGEPTAPTASVVDGDVSLARAAADRAAAAATAQMRVEAVEAAQVAVDEVSRVRSDAAQAAVPDDALAELDAATAALQEAIEDVDSTDLVERSRNVSRSSERTEPTATTTPDASTMAAATRDAAPAPADETPVGDAPTPEVTADALTTDAPAVDPASPADRLADVTLPDTADPATTPLRAALDRVKQAAEVVLTTTEQKKAEAAAAEAAAHAAAEEAARVAAEQAAQRAAWKASLQGYANGHVPASALCDLSFDSSALLRCDAAEALEALDAAYLAQFGTHLDISDTYRSYSAQVACRAAKGNMCAAPGTSNHGMGVAVDLGGRVQTFGTAQHQWMRDNAPAFQWTLPDWARAGGSKPEPWHWEYVG